MVNFVDHFYYDPSSPSCIRRKLPVLVGRLKTSVKYAANTEVGHLSSDGYWVTSLNWEDFDVHNIVYLLHNPTIPSNWEVDHIDGNNSNNLIENLRCVPHDINCRNRSMYSTNSTGVTGVCWIEKVNIGHPLKMLYAVAQCRSLEGKVVGRCFSVKKYGLMPAFKRACDCRADMIASLNAQGADYTDRHGK